MAGEAFLTLISLEKVFDQLSGHETCPTLFTVIEGKLFLGRNPL